MGQFLTLMSPSVKAHTKAGQSKQQAVYGRSDSLIYTVGHRQVTFLCIIDVTSLLAGNSLHVFQYLPVKLKAVTTCLYTKKLFTKESSAKSKKGKLPVAQKPR